MRMNNDEFRSFVLQLAMHQTGNLDGNILHMILGIQTEAGEIADIAKHVVGYNQAINLYSESIKEELGDLLFYLDGLAACFGWSLVEVMLANKDKLQKRYPNGYTNKAALERKDKAQNGSIQTDKNTARPATV